MEIVTRNSLAASASSRWDAQYGRKLLENNKWHTISLGLKALGTEPNPSEVEEVIGNASWTQVMCGECGKDSESVFVFGQNCATVNVCPACVKAATETVDRKLELSTLLDMCLEWDEVGSRVTCDPPVTNTDRDILCRVLDLKKFLVAAVTAGFEVGGSVSFSYQEYSPFTSVTRGDVNLIVTDSTDFASKFMLATRLSKKLNLRVKDDRIALFQAVLYGNG